MWQFPDLGTSQARFLSAQSAFPQLERHVLFQHDTVGKGRTLTQIFSPNSNTSSSMKLFSKTRTGDITSQNGRMRGHALRKKREKEKERNPAVEFCVTATS